MGGLKRVIKRESHNGLFKALAGLGRSLNRFYENRNHDSLSNGEQTLIKKFARLHPTHIIDGGANIGTYSLMVNDILPEATIYAFEPVKETFDQLTQQVAGKNGIKPIAKGLYSENISREINLFKSSTHSSIYEIKGLSYKTEGSTTIELIKGDDFLRQNNLSKIDFLKLDLEGAEYDALLGFKEALENRSIRMIQFEYGYINITTKKLLIDYYELFESQGYRVGKLFPKKVEFRKYEFKHEDFLGPNFVAVHKDDQELIELIS